MTQIYEHSLFCVDLIPKTGSANLQKWCIDNGLTETYDVPKSKPLYSIFRDPQERIPSGIATDINEVVYAYYNIPDPVWDYKLYEKEYLTIIEKWSNNPCVPVQVDNIQAQAKHYLPLNCYIDISQNINWIKLSDLDRFPEYISQTYNIDFPFKLQGAQDHPDQVKWLDWRLFLDKCGPKAHNLINTLIEEDKFIPQEFLKL